MMPSEMCNVAALAPARSSCLRISSIGSRPAGESLFSSSMKGQKNDIVVVNYRPLACSSSLVRDAKEKLESLGGRHVAFYVKFVHQRLNFNMYKGY